MKPRILLAALLAALGPLLTSCSSVFHPSPMPSSDTSTVDPYDKAVLTFERFLDELETIQLVISSEAWPSVEYGNRPRACERGPGAGFNVSRASTLRRDAKETLETDLDTIRKELEALGFKIDGVYADQSSPDRSTPKSVHVVGETGAWLISQQQNNTGILVSGSSNCLDIEPRPVWDEMTELGFSYVGPGRLYLRPEDRLPIRRGETPYAYPATTETQVPTSTRVSTRNPSSPPTRPLRTPSRTEKRQPSSSPSSTK